VPPPPIPPTVLSPLAAAAAAGLDALLIGKAPGANRNLFNADGSRNSACWAAGLDLTGKKKGRYPGVVVTPSNFVAARHVGVGDALWVTADGTEVRPTVVGVTAIPSPTNIPFLSDVAVYRVDPPFPASIAPFRIYHDPGARRWSIDNGVVFVGTLVVDQNDDAWVMDAAPPGGNGFSVPSPYEIRTWRSRDGDWGKHLQPPDLPDGLTFGDSGSPGFLLIDGVLCLDYHANGGTSGPSYSWFYELICDAIDSLNGHALGPYPATADLSAYPLVNPA